MKAIWRNGQEVVRIVDRWSGLAEGYSFSVAESQLIDVLRDRTSSGRSCGSRNEVRLCRLRRCQSRCDRCGLVVVLDVVGMLFRAIAVNKPNSELVVARTAQP